MRSSGDLRHLRGHGRDPAARDLARDLGDAHQVRLYKRATRPTARAFGASPERRLARIGLPEPTNTSTALVTGASSGIGEQLARALAARGHHVTLVARRAERLERLAGELADATSVASDLTDPAARDGLAAVVEGAGRAVEVLVNCAGFGVYGPFHTSDRARELEQVRVLAEAPMDLTHRWLPGMVDRGRGAVINISSTSGFQALPYNAGYAAAKSYLLMLSEALHAEVAEFGVTVTAVCPGPVPTEFQLANEATFAEKLPKAVWVSPERVAGDALSAAERGARVVVPGAPIVRAAFAPNRYAPRGVALALAKRLMAK
jgi:short-subunit dehydrogenase